MSTVDGGIHYLAATNAYEIILLSNVLQEDKPHGLEIYNVIRELCLANFFYVLHAVVQ